MERDEVLKRIKAVLKTDNGKLLMKELRRELVVEEIASSDLHRTLIWAARRDVYTLLENWSADDE